MEPAASRRLYRSRDDRVVGGVAAGIGSHLGVDPVLIRISFVALAFAGIGVLLYLIAWIAIPELPPGEEPAPTSTGDGALGARILIGTVLVVIGILLLLDIYVPIRKIVWPAAVIVVGLAIIGYGARK